MAQQVAQYRHCLFGALIPLLVFGLVGFLIDNAALAAVGVIGSIGVLGIALERRQLHPTVVKAAIEATAVTAVAIVMSICGALLLKYTVAGSLDNVTLHMTAVLFGATAFIPSMKRALDDPDA